MKETIQKIGTGVEFVSIIDPKFKTNTIEVSFLVPVRKETNAVYSLVSALLSHSCKAYPSYAALSRKLNSLYGAALSGNVSKRGDVLRLALEASTIADCYALEQEPLLDELTSLLLECLFAPHVTDGAFDASSFAVKRQSLLDSIDGRINEKRSYAVFSASRTAFAGEAAAYPTYGEREDVEVLTPASAYTAYQNLLKEATVRVHFVGPAEHPALCSRFAEAFAALERCPAAIQLHSPSPCKPEVQHVVEPMEVNQSKLVMIFKGTSGNKDAMRLFNVMFGGSAFALLFMNVREKMSLCYYCSSRLLQGKDAFLVESGVELANAEKAREAILAQLEMVKQGDFSDELLENAKRTVLNMWNGIGDTPYSYIAHSFADFCDGEHCDIAERIAATQAVTREDIMAAANALQEDTVYLMQQEVQHESSN